MDRQQIPDAEELEWLETINFLPEYEEEDEVHINQVVIGRDSDLHEIEVIRKRNRPEENSRNIGEIISREQSPSKRRALEILNQEKDEDIRYSPPLLKASDVHIVSESDHLLTNVLVGEKILSRFIVEIEGDCVPVTGPYGDRVYAKMQPKTMAGEYLNFTKIEKPRDGLLSEPITVLIKKLDHEAFAKVFGENDQSPCHQSHSEVPTIREKLWVEKYTPHYFTELLSDEQTNREVLMWLKQWDSCVFGSQVRLTADDVLSDLRRHSSNIQYQKSSNRRIFPGNGKEVHFTPQNNETWNEGKQSENLNDVSKSWFKKDTIDHPPEHKVLLLCGPPGLGKTTLAHVAAKHCGYRVVEINASDDRSFSALESKILDAVQMNSVTADSKPKCLVIDEIDGTVEGKGAVEVILKMVAADKKAFFEKGNAAQHPLSEKFSKKGKKSASLLRPVICICNDLYAPALRPIRQIAKVHVFVQPTINRVVNRLKDICKKEGLKANSVALAALAEYTECDIRSCLNTLQFLNKKSETLNFLEIGSQVVGQKDITRSCIDIWKKIFQKRKSKHEKRFSNLNGQEDFEDMYSLLSNRGDYDLIMDGIHDNFLKLSYIDPTLTKTVKCLDVLGASDSLHQYIMRTQKMALYAYHPPIMLTISRLIALVEKPNIEWPKSLQRCRAMSIEKKDLLKLWQSKIPPIISRHLSSKCFVEDFVSLFLHILVPPTLRPVALHLFSEKEKDGLCQLVDTMVSYSTTYKNSKAENLKGPDYHGIPNDVPLLTLEPPIDDFIKFKDYQTAHLSLSLAMKQILLHEVEKQRILRESLGRSSNIINECPSDSRASTIANSEVSLGIAGKSGSSERGSGQFTMLKLQNVKNCSNSRMKKIDSSSMTGAQKKHISSTGFFDRFRQGSSTDTMNKAICLPKVATADRDSRPFLFKFNEGFTNAVKRSIKVRELLI